MEQLWWDASFWIALALISSLISLRIGISVALVELIVGIIAGNSFHPEISEWINFLASFGAVILTFLAGAELESQTLKRRGAKPRYEVIVTESSCLASGGCGAVNRRRTSRASDLGVCGEARFERVQWR